MSVTSDQTTQNNRPHTTMLNKTIKEAYLTDVGICNTVQRRYRKAAKIHGPK
jgi:hypothetical protein